MKRKKFSLAHKDEPMEELVRGTDKKTLAVWAVDCTERVLPYFEENYPDDPRPRNALTVLRAWVQTGVFRMADIRGASLASHAAARDVGEDTPSRSAARAAGQAVAIAGDCRAGKIILLHARFFHGTSSPCNPGTQTRKGLRPDLHIRSDGPLRPG